MTKEFNRSLEIAFADFDPNHPLRCQHWTMIWFKNRLIVIGKNNNKTDPIHLKNKLTFHGGGIHFEKKTCSEWNALKKLRNTTNIPFNKVTLVNIRLNKQKQISISKPCVSCQGAVAWLQPKAVFYTDNEGNFIKYE